MNGSGYAPVSPLDQADHIARLEQDLEKAEERIKAMKLRRCQLCGAPGRDGLCWAHSDLAGDLLVETT